MPEPRPSLTRTALLAALCLAAVAPSRAQQPAAAPVAAAEYGLRLYKLGDWRGAVRQLRSAVRDDEGDAALRVRLGRALFRNGELKEARKSFEAALRLRPGHPDAHAALALMHLTSGRHRDAEAEARKALASDPDSAEAGYVLGQLTLLSGDAARALAEADAMTARLPDAAPAHLLRAQALLALHALAGAALREAARAPRGPAEVEKQNALARGQADRLRAAAESFERYSALAPNAVDAALADGQAEALRYYASPGSLGDPSSFYYPADSLTTKAVILSKPEPGYTEEARRAGVTGRVLLRAVLHGSGEVRHVLVLKGLSHGLTEVAVAAARRIRFRPATIRGEAVAQPVVLEYNFIAY